MSANLQPQQPHAGAMVNLKLFLKHEATGGLILVLAAIAALVADNIPFIAPWYDQMLTTPVQVSIGNAVLNKPLILWVNDGLMAVFFLLVGLEIKREVLRGQLSTREQIATPAIAAFGGMVAPALIYSLVASSSPDPEIMRGWAIPAATDIAFALGALAVLGQRVPLALKIFLLALATLDDLGAIIIIALFYTDNLSLISLGMAGAAIIALAVLNRSGVTRLAPYMFIGIALWIFVLKSGVHATLAGVVLGLAIPFKKPDGTPIIAPLEHALHPYIVWLILPLFAFANAGIPLAGMTFDTVMQPLPMAIVAGLLIGKPLGIITMTWLGQLTGLARLPAQLNMRHIIGVSFLAGIGFTMSLFIGTLAFAADHHGNGVRIGVIIASVLAAIIGMVLLRFWAKPVPTENAQ